MWLTFAFLSCLFNGLSAFFLESSFCLFSLLLFGVLLLRESNL